MSQVTPKLIKCHEYGMLRNAPRAEEETWIFETHDREYEYTNYTFIATLDELSMEGWDLVCKDGIQYILRMLVEKEEPQLYEDDEE
ncbi:hypothetical protein [Paenibacillus sp. NPDC058071]|uniref:hypothetical protein n=1 Tax=Paenibacillus sp. NPDC058071 TaxID=3346326 RepID=UPI0036D9227A